MFSIHDKVCWKEITNHSSFIKTCIPDFSIPSQTFKLIVGKIVDELDNDRYLVKRDDTGECEKLCYRKLRKV